MATLDLVMCGLLRPVKLSQSKFREFAINPAVVSENCYNNMAISRIRYRATLNQVIESQFHAL